MRGAVFRSLPWIGRARTIDGRGEMVNKIIDVLIHRYVYVESTFGSEREFIDTLIRIIRALLS